VGIPVKFTCILPDKEGTALEFYRSPFFGSLTISTNGKKVLGRSVFNPSTHFGFTLKRNYEFSLPGPEPRHVCVTKKRPLLFAGFRPHSYQVAFNGVEIGSFVGR
jgi:hypothetical protein